MACVTPLEGWLSKKRNVKTGKRSVVFNPNEGFSNKHVVVPCGRCIGCRLEYARQWAMRCMHESMMHDENCFITLTYDDEFLPEGGSLRKSDFQRFMKRLRSRFDDRKIRFFHSGEYGDTTFRPHYHCLLFGFDFPDKVRWVSRDGYPVWHSEILEGLWPYGMSEIGSVTFDSAAYVAKYVIKKFKGPKEVKEKYYDGLEPEYATMSRRPGIGKPYYEKYGDDVRKFDSVIVNGKEVRPPKFYDKLFEAAAPVEFALAKINRKKRLCEFEERDGRGDTRRFAEQSILEAKISLKGGVL